LDSTVGSQDSKDGWSKHGGKSCRGFNICLFSKDALLRMCLLLFNSVCSSVTTFGSDLPITVLDMLASFKATSRGRFVEGLFSVAELPLCGANIVDVVDMFPIGGFKMGKTHDGRNMLVYLRLVDDEKGCCDASSLLVLQSCHLEWRVINTTHRSLQFCSFNGEFWHFTMGS
jgi:hypothetical protein